MSFCSDLSFLCRFPGQDDKFKACFEKFNILYCLKLTFPKYFVIYTLTINTFEDLFSHTFDNN